MNIPLVTIVAAPFLLQNMSCLDLVVNTVAIISLAFLERQLTDMDEMDYTIIY